MDTIIMLGSLLGMGYFLNQEKQTRNRPPTRDIVDPKDVPNSYGIYEGNMVNIVRQHEQGLGNNLYKKSKNAKKTRVIPPLYNLGNPTGKKIKKKSVVSSRPGSPPQKKELSLPKDVRLENREDYNPLDVAVHDKEAGGFNEILSQNFSHQNMVPFFSGTGTNQNVGSNTQPSILERFTGKGTLLKPGKKEADAFFQPQKNPNVFTTDIPDDDKRTRFHTSELKTDQLPFEQEYIGPGLNNGFGKKGIDGFHPTYRPPQQTVEELRVETNPKEQYGGRLTAATPIYNQERGQQSILRKNQPERTFEQLSFISATPTGVSTRHSIPDNFENIQNTFRSQENEISGRIGNSQLNKNMVQGQYSDPSKRAEETYDMGALSKPVPKHIVYDESDLPQTTVKQTTMTSYVGNVNRDKGKGYLTTTYLAPTTTKETTQTAYKGIAEGDRQPMSQQQYYNTEINGLKELTINNRKPTTVGEQLFSGKESVNQKLQHSVRHELHEEMAKYKNITSIYDNTKNLPSTITSQKLESAMIQHRIDPIFTEQVRSNPYNHSFN